MAAGCGGRGCGQAGGQRTANTEWFSANTEWWFVSGFGGFFPGRSGGWFRRGSDLSAGLAFSANTEWWPGTLRQTEKRAAFAACRGVCAGWHVGGVVAAGCGGLGCGQAGNGVVFSQHGVVAARDEKRAAFAACRGVCGGFFQHGVVDGYAPVLRHVAVCAGGGLCAAVVGYDRWRSGGRDAARQVANALEWFLPTRSGGGNGCWMRRQRNAQATYGVLSQNILRVMAIRSMTLQSPTL